MSNKESDKSDESSSFATAKHAQDMAEILGLSVRPEWEASVVLNLNLLELAAVQVLSFELPDDTEPAVVFAPV